MIHCLYSLFFLVDTSGGFAETTQLTTEPDQCSLLKKGLKWFCGLDAPETSGFHINKPNLRDVTSLHQTTKAKAALYSAVLALFCCNIFLYVFFSTGSDFGLLRDSLRFTSNDTLSSFDIGNSTVDGVTILFTRRWLHCTTELWDWCIVSMQLFVHILLYNAIACE